MLLASPSIFPMIGWYQIYIMDVIAQLVPASPIIFPMIGRYQIYMMDVVAQMVPAGPIIFPHDRPVPDIHNEFDRTNGTGWPFHIFQNPPEPDIRDGFESKNGTRPS